MFSCEHCKTIKNTYFEKHLRTAASDSGYILLKKLNKIVQESDCLCFILKYKITVLLTLIRIQSFYHSLSFAALQCHFLLLVAIRCQSLYHSLSLAVTCCTARLSFYKRSFSSIDLLDSKVKFQRKFDRW